jgi:molecular chaperone GrpE (heat shock protein)
MAYVEVPNKFMHELQAKLEGNARLVERYWRARNKRDELRQASAEAQQEFEQVRSELADKLLDVHQDIDRVEHHKKGEAW